MTINSDVAVKLYSVEPTENDHNGMGRPSISTR